MLNEVQDGAKVRVSRAQAADSTDAKDMLLDYREALEISFRDALELPEDAIAWLLDLWNLIQVLDDVADGDAVDRKDLDAATYACLAGMPANSFYQRHQTWLIPVMSVAVMKWMASDIVEREGCADERSYMWRAGYYDVIVMVSSIVHGPSSEKALIALRMYGERATDYLKEFDNA